MLSGGRPWSGLEHQHPRAGLSGYELRTSSRRSLQRRIVAMVGATIDPKGEAGPHPVAQFLAVKESPAL
jgi:hypothetical protein